MKSSGSLWWPSLICWHDSTNSPGYSGVLHHTGKKSLKSWHLHFTLLTALIVHVCVSCFQTRFASITNSLFVDLCFLAVVCFSFAVSSLDLSRTISTLHNTQKSCITFSSRTLSVKNYVSIDAQITCWLNTCNIWRTEVRFMFLNVKTFRSLTSRTGAFTFTCFFSIFWVEILHILHCLIAYFLISWFCMTLLLNDLLSAGWWWWWWWYYVIVRQGLASAAASFANSQELRNQ